MNLPLHLARLAAYRWRRHCTLARLYRESQVSHPRWWKRFADVLLCPEGRDFPRVAGAGEVKEEIQTMHNGIKIHANRFYGADFTEMIRLSRGLHEPQVEQIFHHLLKGLRPDPVCVELGSYWAYYTLWLKTTRPRSRALLLDIKEEYLQVGRDNFALNAVSGEFFHLGISGKSDPSAVPPLVSLDDFTRQQGLDRIDLLFSDIQGHELSMLEGAEELLKNHRIDWLMISTHVDHALHTECKERLKHFGYVIPLSLNLDETYSDDGLVLARSPQTPPVDFPTPSRRPRKWLQALG